jgi:hypothetical protein
LGERADASLLSRNEELAAMKKSVMIPEERTSAKERAFGIFMVVAGVFGFVVPIAASSADVCHEPLGLFSVAPMLQAFIQYSFVSMQDVCSFEWLFIWYSIIIILGFMFIGWPMPPILINRALSAGRVSPKFWNLTIILFSCYLLGIALLFLIYQYNPYASSLNSLFVAKTWFLTKLSLCLGSWAVGFACFHVLWSIFDGGDHHE